MTGKTPVRMAEDVDDTALSYAEIKALATGNPLIIEKCQLDMDVGRLKLLHAGHLSQKYELEDCIRREYPMLIKQYTEYIAGYKADAETVSQHPSGKDNFAPMTVKDHAYTDKKEAGTAIIEACKAMNTPEPVPIGRYRGFDMTLAFDSYARDYYLTLKGAFDHDVKLGTDIHGNITRIDNVLESLHESIARNGSKLALVQTQIEAAKAEVDRPFPQAQEYEEKSARLKELNILLKLDEKDAPQVFEAEPDERDDSPTQRVAERAR